MRLTKTVADAAQYPEDQDDAPEILWDDDVAGFGLRVYPSGKKSFVFDYRMAGRKRRLTLGQYGSMTMQQARKRARKAKVQVADGIDPREERRRRRERAKLLRDLAAEYMDEVKAKRKESTVRSYQQLLDTHILPEFGKLQPAAITEDDVRRFHRARKGTPYAANRALWLLGKLLDIAEKRGVRDPGTNPADAVKRYPEKARKRHLSSDELKRLGEALQELEESKSVSVHAAAAIRLLLFTGARVNEILTLRWEHIDLQSKTATLPDSKTGEKRFPLTAPVLEVLDNLPRTKGNPWVVEGQRKKSHLTDLRRPWQRLRTKAEIEDVRLHDLRHTVGAWGASSGLSLLLVGEILGHKQAASTERYAHLQDDPVREAAERVSGAIKGALSGQSAEVVDYEESA